MLTFKTIQTVRFKRTDSDEWENGFSLDDGTCIVDINGIQVDDCRRYENRKLEAPEGMHFELDTDIGDSFVLKSIISRESTKFSDSASFTTKDVEELERQLSDIHNTPPRKLYRDEGSKVLSGVKIPEALKFKGTGNHTISQSMPNDSDSFNIISHEHTGEVPIIGSPEMVSSSETLRLSYDTGKVEGVVGTTKDRFNDAPQQATRTLKEALRNPHEDDLELVPDSTSVNPLDIYTEDEIFEIYGSDENAIRAENFYRLNRRDSRLKALYRENGELFAMFTIPRKSLLPVKNIPMESWPILSKDQERLDLCVASFEDFKEIVVSHFESKIEFCPDGFVNYLTQYSDKSTMGALSRYLIIEESGDTFPHVRLLDGCGAIHHGTNFLDLKRRYVTAGKLFESLEECKKNAKLCM